MQELQQESVITTCRLCYCQTIDHINIYSENNLLYEYERKINKYLYFQISKNDEYSNSICWNCLNQLETFHKFYEKINDIQKKVLKERYDLFSLKAIYHTLNTNFNLYSLPPERQISTKYDNEIQPQENENIKIENDFNSELTNCNPDENEIPDGSIETNEINLNNDVSEVTKNEDLSTNNDEFHSITTSSTPPLTTTNNFYMSTRSKTLKITTNKSESESSDDTDDKSDEKFNFDLSAKNHKTKSLSDKNEKPPELILINKRKRGRPRGGVTSDKPVKIINYVNVSSSSSVVNHQSKKNLREISQHDDDDEEGESGESGNEFPARDSDNDDWPAQQTLNKFPNKILENGLLLVKGKKLLTMICKFYKLECELCVNEKRRFKQLKELFKHYSDNHKEDGYVKCCQTKLNRYPAIIMHMARHLQPDEFKCNICNYMVTRPRFLVSHKQTHLPEEEKPYACDQCPRRFCWKGALQIHQISHQPVDKRKLYICHVCGKIYDTPGGLSTHKKLVHTDRKAESHVCHVCAKTFATRTGLNEHMSTIHQPREKDQVQCTDCGKWLMNNRCLKSHMMLHSSVIYDCRICSYTTKKPMLLRRHLLTQHSDEKPFNCEICGKSFKLKRALTVHIAQHGQTKSYKCTFCERIFASSTNFYTHRKNIHPIELQELKERELEEKRQKRISAGIEMAAENKLLLESQLYDDDDEEHDEDDIVDDGNNVENIIDNNYDDDDLLPLRDNNKIYSINLPTTTIPSDEQQLNDNFIEKQLVSLQTSSSTSSSTTLSSSSSSSITTTTSAARLSSYCPSPNLTTRQILINNHMMNVDDNICDDDTRNIQQQRNNNCNETSLLLNVEQLNVDNSIQQQQHHHHNQI